jgi:signal transduction histidine kinase
VLFDETVTPPLFTEEDLPSFVQEIATDPVFAGADAVGRVRLTTRCRNGRLAFCPVLLRHALGNLVRNALRYSPRTSTVELVIGGRGDRRWIHVLNRGPRIPDAIAARLFEPGKKHPQGGMGFGLHVARTCMERMGGSVAFGSTRRATVFSLLFAPSRPVSAGVSTAVIAAGQGSVACAAPTVPGPPVLPRKPIAPQRFVAAPLIDFPRPIPAG